MIFISLGLSILFPCLAYIYVRHGNPACTLRKRDLVKGALLGATLCTLVIMVTETVWDRLFDPTGSHSLKVELLGSFFRAALLEEGAKFVFVLWLRKKHPHLTRLDAVLLAGTVGIGYGITEKLAMGNAVALAVNSVLLFHMMFQFLMGWHLWPVWDKPLPSFAWLRAFLFPLVMHGVWDALVCLAEAAVNSGVTLYESLGAGAMLVLVGTGVVIELATLIHLRNLPPDAKPEENE